jgi:hypothetical protein
MRERDFGAKSDMFYRTNGSRGSDASFLNMKNFTIYNGHSAFVSSEEKLPICKNKVPDIKLRMI